MNQELSDIDSFQKFYHQHFAPVVRYCTTIVKDKADASDIVQQAFITLWQRRKNVLIHTSPKAYLYKAVYNFSVNSLKQTAARKLREKRSDFTKTEFEQTDVTAERELKGLIEEAVRKLPEGCRQIFQMSRDEGLKYRQIADTLNISEKTVENQMGKALRLLRMALQDYLLFFILLMLLTNE